jgi:hypothetical protein
MIPKVEPLIQSLNEMSSSYFLAERQMSATAMVSIPSQITATLTMLLVRTLADRQYYTLHYPLLWNRSHCTILLLP